MAKKRKINVGEQSEGSFNNPFADLAHLRDQLASEAPLPEDPPEAPSPIPESPAEKPERYGKIVLRREKKGRRGKTVTRVTGATLPKEALVDLAKDLKRSLGCGAVVEDGDILLQGDQTERAGTYFEKKGARKVVIGS